MTSLRALIAILMTLSLVVVPASVGASAAGMASIAVSGVSECGPPCPMANQVDTMAGMIADMPTSGDCNGMSGKNAPNSVPMTPSACATFCAGFVALPATHIVLVREMSGKPSIPDVHVLLTGRVDPPEPYPPRS